MVLLTSVAGFFEARAQVTNHAQNQPVSGSGVVKRPLAVTGAEVAVIVQSYTYPMSVSLEGDYVTGTNFGGSLCYHWEAATGNTVQIQGTVGGVAESGVVGGAFRNSTLQYNGQDVEAAGIWDVASGSWTFAGMNPAVPAFFSTDYNTGWDITSDGTTLVGMQWYPNYDYSAFKWTQSGGYVNIGAGVGNGSRASGISANGTVVYGWAEVPAASRTPVVWYNGQALFIDNSQFGEAYGASPNGNYITGELSGSGFLWTPQGTTFFSNTLNSQNLMPTTVLNDGTVMGYTVPAWPPIPTSRRAFVRNPQGAMTTFNDYAEDRGLDNAQAWTFYSINDATADGDKFLGAGITPQGQDVTFLISFNNNAPVFSINPESVAFGDQLIGVQSDFVTLVITNTGTGDLVVSSVQLAGSSPQSFVADDNNVYPLSLQPNGEASFSVAFAPAIVGLHEAGFVIQTNAGDFNVALSGYGVDGVGVDEFSSSGLQVFPIPADRFLTVRSCSAMAFVELADGSGRSVLRAEVQGSDGYKVDVSAIQSGVYVLKMVAEDGSVRHQKILIQH